MFETQSEIAGTSDPVTRPVPGEYRRVAQHVMGKVFCVRPGERVLVITDTITAEFADPFIAAASALKAEALLMRMAPRSYPGESLPEPMNAAIRSADVVVGCVSRSIAAPIWMNINSDPSVTTRGASISEISDVVMRAGGLLAEPEELMRITESVYEAVRGAAEWRLTTSNGTDLRARIATARIVERQPISKPRMGGVLPGCEVALDPIIGTVSGVFWSDGSCGLLDRRSLGYDGTLREPIKCVVEDGSITEISGATEATLLRDAMASIGSCAHAISHLAIGCNPLLRRLTGAYICDEKILGGVHVASAGTDGCRSGHIDHCLQHPSLWIDDVQVIDDFKLVGPLADVAPERR